MKKNYVLDTNVLLHDPLAVTRFEDNDVVLPITVLEEVDRFKKEGNELGRNARMVSRILDDLRERNGSLATGAALDSGGHLRVVLPDVRQGPMPRNPDQAILVLATQVRDQDPAVPTVLVTMDTNLRVRADALGLAAESYKTDKVPLDELYTGATTLDVPPADFDALKNGGAPLARALYPNQFALLRDETNPSHTTIARADATGTKMQPVRVPRDGVWGVRPRNKEQTFALDLLLDDSIKMVTLVGKAGTGKTLLALAAGLRKVADEEVYARMLVSRPIFPLGRDLGYLPGDVGEKLHPWMQPIFDNLELILGGAAAGGGGASGGAAGGTGSGHRPSGRGARTFASLSAQGLIEVEPLTYIRGRSLPNQFLVVDEAQNLTPHEVKTIITRVGPNTKIVLTGDPYQIDNPYVDAASNGLTRVADRLKKEGIAGHVLLTKGERSELAELAANLL